MRLHRSIVLSAIPLGLWIAASAYGQTRIQPGFNLFSVQQDIEIGRQSAAKVDRQLPMLDQPASSRLVERVGARLAVRAPGARFPYRFKVVNLSDLNAFALPGGFIYIHRGLLEGVRTEGELAGVMAHEIAHVALRHPTNQVTKAYAARAGIEVINQLIGNRGQTRTGQIIGALGGFGLNTLFLRFSRSAERQADILGAQIMAKAGYDPLEMANFFQLMRQQAGREPSTVARFFSDHPSPADREARVRDEARLLAVRRTTPVGGLRTAQAELRQLPPARKMSQIAGGAIPERSTGMAMVARGHAPSAAATLPRRGPRPRDQVPENPAA
jgi:predicted Zn-dependent protease